MLQMTVIYTTIFQSGALQNVPKFGIFGLKIEHPATLLVGKR
jgi:hypothetical protein